MSRSISRRRFLGAGTAWLGSTVSNCSGAQPAQRVRDIVVVVPGIMGSVLTSRNETLWGIDGSSFIQLLKAGNIDFRKLRTDANPPKEIDRPTRLLDSVQVIPGFWKVDGYTELREGLIERMQLQRGANYFEFAYDWRQDNRISARQLMERISGWLGEWRETTKNADAKAIVVAHSMGGLVARYATEVLNGWPAVRAVFSIGTPYQGSVRALERLALGFLTAGLTTTLRTFDSVYQLLPTYSCVEHNGRLTTLDRHNDMQRFIDSKRFVELGRSFHAECDSAASRNLSLASRGELCVMQGYTHKTAASVRVTASGLSIVDSLKGQEFGGDGTVPGLQLAKPGFSSARLTEYYCNQMHGSIQNNAQVLDHIVGSLLANAPSSLERTSGETISLKAVDWLKAGQSSTVDVTFTRRQTPALVPVRIYRVETDTMIHEQALNTRDARSFSLSVRLDHVGIYRISVGDPIICSDLIAVV